MKRWPDSACIYVVSCVYCIHTSSAVHSHIDCLSNTITRARIAVWINCLNDTAIETRWCITRTSSTNEAKMRLTNCRSLHRTIGLVAVPEPPAAPGSSSPLGKNQKPWSGRPSPPQHDVRAHYMIILIVKLPQCTEVHIAVVGQNLSHEGEVRWSLRVDLHQRPEKDQQ